MYNLVGKSKQLILNFLSEMMNVNDMKVYPVRNFERTDALIQIYMDQYKSLNHRYTQISSEQIKEWSIHPNNLFLACQYKDWFMGLFLVSDLNRKFLINY